ncbi:hypothetical protein [Yersinia canariae]|uniref:hypothetical protein n=1 Tax=Yersinia canariae TaxID=2607663 RepID=UPI0011A72B7F|nr:hypothetical protein [Yersinia canariae]
MQMNKLTEQQLQKIANPGESDIGGTQSPIVTQMATELLSLRAELAAIKGQELAGLNVEDVTEFMRRAFWRGFESARGTENSNIPAEWKDSKPNLLLALKAKISSD